MKKRESLCPYTRFYVPFFSISVVAKTILFGYFCIRTENHYSFLYSPDRQTDRPMHSRSCGRPSRGRLESSRVLSPRRNRPILHAHAELASHPAAHGNRTSRPRRNRDRTAARHHRSSPEHPDHDEYWKEDGHVRWWWRILLCSIMARSKSHDGFEHQQKLVNW